MVLLHQSVTENLEFQYQSARSVYITCWRLKKTKFTYAEPSGRMILSFMWSTTWSSKTWSINFITNAYLSPNSDDKTYSDSEWQWLCIHWQQKYTNHVSAVTVADRISRRWQCMRLISYRIVPYHIIISTGFAMVPPTCSSRCHKK